MRGACIDIGSNTTRLLVADCDGQRLREVHQERVFTRTSRGLANGGTISAQKIAEVAGVVAQQVRQAQALGADEIHPVATAAIRRAGNGAELADAVRAACGLQVRILTDTEEARLAFVGVARTLERAPSGTLGVVDVGGGSSELVMGQAPEHVTWCASLPVGSGDLADEFLRSDPPSAEQLDRARRRVAEAIEQLEAPRPAAAIAVGGSATSLRQLAGDLLDGATFSRTLEALMSGPAPELSRRFGLDPERVHLMPAGLLILQAAADLFGVPLHIGRGGIREAVLLEAGA